MGTLIPKATQRLAKTVTVADVLDGAADLIERQGHTFEEWELGKREHGKLGAEASIYVYATGTVNGGAPAGGWSWEHERGKTLASAAIDACHDYIGGSLDSWERCEAESGAEVIEMLRFVAQHEREVAEQEAAEYAKAREAERVVRAVWAVAS